MRLIDRLLLLLLLLIPATVFAADTALPSALAPVDDKPLAAGAQAALTALYVLASALSALLGWVSYHVALWIKSRTRNELVGGVLSRTVELVFTLVREAEQTAVYELRKARDPKSPGGASITQSEGKQIKEAVISKLKELYGPKGLEELGKVLGLTPGGVSQFLNAKVEEACLAENARNP
jgi:hypothetical protein